MGDFGYRSAKSKQFRPKSTKILFLEKTCKNGIKYRSLKTCVPLPCRNRVEMKLQNKYKILKLLGSYRLMAFRYKLVYEFRSFNIVKTHKGLPCMYNA